MSHFGGSILGSMCEPRTEHHRLRNLQGTRGANGPPPVPFREAEWMFKHIALKGRVRRVLISTRLVELEG